MDGRIIARNFSRITVVSIRRPATHNAMTSDMWRELAESGKQIAANPRTRVVLLRGAFDYFTAGSDIKEFSQTPVEHVDETFALMEEAITTFENLPVPTIACIKGEALGGGLQLALACDLRVSANNAKFGIPVARMGITIGVSFARRMVDLIGPSRTKDLLFTGRIMGTQEAHELGLVNYTTPVGKVENFALRLAKTIADQSPASVQVSKKMVALCCTPQASLAAEKSPYWVDTEDFQEGVAAFVEKRRPVFRSRS